MLELVQVFASLREVHKDASVARRQGNLRQAEDIDKTLLRVAFPLLLTFDMEDGQVRASCLLAQLAQPQPIDVLVSPTWSLATIRIETLLFLPMVAQITTLDQVESAITEAIQFGAPAYNDGDVRGCATCYWATAFGLLQAPTPRGVAGLARVLRPLRSPVEETGPSLGDDARAIDDFAWRMRQALDASLAAIR